MSTEKSVQVTCLCGAVKISATQVGTDLQACHCQQCQTWTGGGPYICIRVKDAKIDGAETLRSYQASSHGERAFCGTCGTPLYWRLQGHKVAFLPVGLFKDQSDMEMREEIFVDHRPGWLPAWPDATEHTEAEMQAQLADFLEGDTQ